MISYATSIPCYRIYGSEHMDLCGDWVDFRSLVALMSTLWFIACRGRGSLCRVDEFNSSVVARQIAFARGQVDDFPAFAHRADQMAGDQIWSPHLCIDLWWGPASSRTEILQTGQALLHA